MLIIIMISFFWGGGEGQEGRNPGENWVGGALCEGEKRGRQVGFSWWLEVGER